MTSPDLNRLVLENPGTTLLAAVAVCVCLTVCIGLALNVMLALARRVRVLPEDAAEGDPLFYTCRDILGQRKATQADYTAAITAGQETRARLIGEELDRLDRLLDKLALRKQDSTSAQE